MQRYGNLNFQTLDDENEVGQPSAKGSLIVSTSGGRREGLLKQQPRRIKRYAKEPMIAER